MTTQKTKQLLLANRMLNFSMIVSGSAAITYLLDTHGPNAVHCLAISNFSKNMVLYGSTYFANGMVENRGVKVALLILGACHTFCFLGSIPMYIFGKRVRSFVSLFLIFTRLFESMLIDRWRIDCEASEFLCCR